MQHKATDLDTPDPEWKYLSGFAIHEGQPRPLAKEPLGDLIVPRRGPTNALSPAAPTPDQVTQQPHPITNQNNEDVVPNRDEPPTTAVQAPTTQHVHEQGPQNNAVRQTRSGRVVMNTSQYSQSITQRSQGLVAWEVLVDQDERWMYRQCPHNMPCKRLWKTPLPSQLPVTQTSSTGTKR